jgi:hypothetical protein
MAPPKGRRPRRRAERPPDWSRSRLLRVAAPPKRPSGRSLDESAIWPPLITFAKSRSQRCVSRSRPPRIPRSVPNPPCPERRPAAPGGREQGGDRPAGRLDLVRCMDCFATTQRSHLQDKPGSTSPRSSSTPLTARRRRRPRPDRPLGLCRAALRVLRWHPQAGRRILR